MSKSQGKKQPQVKSSEFGPTRSTGPQSLLEFENEFPDFQQELEHELLLNPNRSTRIKNLPNDWQDFEPSNWDDTDSYS